MPELFRPSLNTELRLPSTNPLLEQGMYDFRQAIEFSTTTTPSDRLNAIQMVAESMTEVGIAPYAALDALEGYSPPDERYVEHRNAVRADIFAMLGEEDNMRQVLKETAISKHWRLSPYLIAIETRVRNGIDPKDMVEEAMDSIARIPSRKGLYEMEDNFKAGEYLRVATQLVTLDLDETAPLARAMEAIDGFRDKQFIPDHEVEYLLQAYAKAGKSEKAMDIFTSLTSEVHDGLHHRSRRAVLDAFINAGQFEEAMQFVAVHGMVRDTIPLILAKKAIHDATEGYDIRQDIADISLMAQVVDSEGRFEDIYPLLGIALAKSGAETEAQEMFTTIEQAIHSDDVDILLRSNMYFTLAYAVHDAGLDSDDIFTRAWDYSKKWWEDEEVKSWARALPIGLDNEVSIQETIKRGKLEHARQAIESSENVGWWKAQHTAQLAAMEIRTALVTNKAA